MDPSTQTAMEKESFIASKAYRKAPCTGSRIAFLLEEYSTGIKLEEQTCKNLSFFTPQPSSPSQFLILHEIQLSLPVDKKKASLSFFQTTFLNTQLNFKARRI